MTPVTFSFSPLKRPGGHTSQARLTVPPSSPVTQIVASSKIARLGLGSDSGFLALSSRIAQAQLLTMTIPMITRHPRHPPTSSRGSDLLRLANASLQTSRCSYEGY